MHDMGCRMSLRDVCSEYGALDAGCGMKDGGFGMREVGYRTRARRCCGQRWVSSDGSWPLHHAQGLQPGSGQSHWAGVGVGLGTAVHDLCLSVCLSSLPAGAAFALPFPLVAAEVHAHLTPVPPAEQPPSQGSPFPHRQEALRQHLRFPVSYWGAAGGCWDPHGAPRGWALWGRG